MSRWKVPEHLKVRIGGNTVFVRLHLINPSNPLVSIVRLEQSRWNRYRVWQPPFAGVSVLADSSTITLARRDPRQVLGLGSGMGHYGVSLP